MRYMLRYTSDGLLIDESDTLEDLTQRQSDYIIHVWDKKAGKVVWQNSESVRYGKIGLDTKD